MIPKMIHYCWFGGKPLPKIVKKCLKSWKKFCPDYEIKCWDENNFDVTCHPFIKDAYQAKAWAFVSDYARLKIVYDNGGVYIDTDVEMLKNFDSLLQHKAYFAMQQVGGLINTGIGFGAEKQNTVLEKMLEEYDGLMYSDEKKYELACPFLNSAAVGKVIAYDSDKVSEREGVAVYPPKYFDPIAPGDTQNLLCGDSYSLHHASASWMSGKAALKRKILNSIGISKVDRIKRFIHGNKE